MGREDDGPRDLPRGSSMCNGGDPNRSGGHAWRLGGAASSFGLEKRGGRCTARRGGEIERFRDQYDRIAAHWERIYQQGADVLALVRMVKERAKHVGGGLRRLAGQ